MKITWKVPEGNPEHNIPEGAVVTFSCNGESVDIKFDEEEGRVIVVTSHELETGEIVEEVLLG